MYDLDKDIKELQSIFENNNFEKAHGLAADVLKRMAADDHCLFEVVNRNIVRDDFFNQPRINPVIAFNIEENKNFSLVAHAFMPHPDRLTNISHQSIHHHGNLLLSTINAFGPGYDSLLFKKGYQINGEEVELILDKSFHHGPKALEFIPGNSPHIVFFPPEVTITYALWSTTVKAKTDALKKSSLLKPVKKQLKGIISKTGLTKVFNLNQIEYVDFYVENGKFKSMKERIRYIEASNQNFLQNFFYLLQEIGYSNQNYLQTTISNLPAVTKEKVNEFAIPFIEGKELRDSLEPVHLHMDKVHLNRKEIEEALK